MVAAECLQSRHCCSARRAGAALSRLRRRHRKLRALQNNTISGRLVAERLDQQEASMCSAANLLAQSLPRAHTLALPRRCLRRRRRANHALEARCPTKVCCMDPRIHCCNHAATWVVFARRRPASHTATWAVRSSAVRRAAAHVRAAHTLTNRTASPSHTALSSLHSFQF